MELSIGSNGDGMNWYSYVGGDPVNRTDPNGMVCIKQNWSMHAWDGNTGKDTGKIAGSEWVEIVGCTDEFAQSGSRGLLASFIGGLVGSGGETPQRSQATNRAGGGRTRKISRCMRGWLTDHYPGFDWSRSTISSDSPLPGMAASTNSDLTVFVGGGRDFDNFERNTRLFFHEVAHFPQWAGGSLTTLGYIGSAIRHGGVHGNIPVEIEANAVRDFLNQAYKDEGKPCG